MDVQEKLPTKEECYNKLTRPHLTESQYFLSKIIGVGLAMVLGSTAAVSGVVLLLLSAISTTVLGIVLSSFALVAGLAITFAGYIWFTP